MEMKKENKKEKENNLDSNLHDLNLIYCHEFRIKLVQNVL